MFFMFCTRSMNSITKLIYRYIYMASITRVDSNLWCTFVDVVYLRQVSQVEEGQLVT